jgi:thioredoxin-dependent peroxiredoxin
MLFCDSFYTEPHGSGGRMLRIILLLVAVVAIAVLVVPGVLSRSVKPVEGSTAPDFTLPSQDGLVSLKDYRGKWVVLYFYPKDQTPG